MLCLMHNLTHTCDETKQSMMDMVQADKSLYLCYQKNNKSMAQYLCSFKAKVKAVERISEEKIVVEMLNGPRVAAPHGAIIHTDSGIFYGASWGSRPPPWYYLNHGGALGRALGKAANLELVAVGELGSLAWRATRVILPCEELLFRYDDVPASWGARARAEQPFCVRVPPRRP